MRVAGQVAGKAFVLRFTGTPSEATRRADQAFMELKDATGRWRELEVVLATEGTSRLNIGRDKSKAQISVEGKGEGLVQCVVRCMEGADKLIRRADGMVTLNRRPLANVASAGHGETEVLWNAAEVAGAGVPKAQILADLALLLPASREWAS